MIFLCFIFVLNFSAIIINIPDDQPTIQAGIDIAVVSDTILIQPGTYVENINYNGKNITVASLFLTTQDTTYISNTIIDGSQPSYPLYGSTVTFSNGENSSAILTGFTITGGSGTIWYTRLRGGGIFCVNSNPTMNNLIITENSMNDYESFGGGAYFDNSNIILSNSVISDNFSFTGAGICCIESDYILENNILNNNIANDKGGALYSMMSSADMHNCSIVGNTSYDGAGIYFDFTVDIVSVENLIITENNSSHAGGGVYCYSSDFELSNFSIFNNAASVGGGITFDMSNPIFNSENRCSIYNNISYDTRGTGLDIFSRICSPFDVIVDTFSVFTPNDYYASPIDNYTFDIIHWLENNFVDSDLYVSVDGDDANSGLNPEDPLKTIRYALSIIESNNTIYLADGEYSPSTNGEIFPLILNNHLDLVGESMENTILNAENTNNVVRLYHSDDITLRNLTIANGNSEFGGGIYCYISSALFENLTIMNNTAAHRGGGINIMLSSPQLSNVIFYNNSSAWGGGLFCYYSSTKLNSSTFTNNTSTLGGAIHTNHSNLEITNNTIVDNSAQAGNGIYLTNESSVILVNSILWNNNFEFYFSEFNSINFLTVTHCDILNGVNSIFNNNVSIIHWLENNIDSDPLFCDPTNNNFHLTVNSPCIDTGTAYFEWEGEVILDLSPDEYFCIAPDMGAYEWQDVGIQNEEILNHSSLITNLSIYPNPFNPSTTIEFSIQNDSNINLSIYNIKGQKIKTLVNNKFNEGSHSIIWNGEAESGKSVSSGIYYYSLKVNGITEAVKKCLLLK